MRSWIFTALFWVCAATALAQSMEVALVESFKEGDWEKAEAVLTKALWAKTIDGSLALELASLRRGYGDEKGAVDAYELYLMLGEDPRIKVELGGCLARMGRTEEAGKMLQEALKENPANADSFWYLARLEKFQAYDSDKKRKESYEKRLDWLEKLCVLKPDFALAYVEWGEVLESLGRNNMAVQAYEKGLKADRSYRFLHARLARLYRQGGEIKMAMSAYEKAVAVDPSDEALAGERKIFLEGIRNDVQERKETRLKKWAAWTPSPMELLPPSTKEIRIGLMEGMRRLVFKGSGSLVVKGKDAAQPITLEAGGDYQALLAEGKQWVIADSKGNSRLVFKEWVEITPGQTDGWFALHAVGSGNGYFFAMEEDRAYRGALKLIVSEKGGLTAVNRVSQEEYVASVLPSEMPPSWHLEALKAQAVAARTEALFKQGRHSAGGYDLCDEVHCQAYAGIKAETKATNQAVRETAGMVLWDGAKPFPAVYSAQCGGHTQDYQEAWCLKLPGKGVDDLKPSTASAKDFPLTPLGLEAWIKKAPDAYCFRQDLKEYRNFRWVYPLKACELEKKGNLRDLGRIKEIRVTRRSKSGWASMIVLEGEKGSREFKWDSIRSVLGGIRSNLIWIETWKGSDGYAAEFEIYGGGWGHGVGMCQLGALGLAQEGRLYKDILAHYYPEAQIGKIIP